MATVEQRVRDVAGDIISLPEDADRDLKLSELGLDSLDITEFVMELEEEFDFTVNEDAAQKWQTLGDVIDYVAENSNR